MLEYVEITSSSDVPSGFLGRSIYFDGEHSEVDVQLGSGDTGSGDFTIETWVKIEDWEYNGTVSLRPIFSAFTEDNDSLKLFASKTLTNDPMLRLSLLQGGEVKFDLFSLPGSIQEGVWTHIAVEVRAKGIL
jgi:hypothetical protein